MTASRWPTGPLHPAQRRYLAEDLLCLHRSDEKTDRPDEPPRARRALDHDLARTVSAYLEARDIAFDETPGDDFTVLRILPSPHLPADLRGGTTVVAGHSPPHASLHLRHPLVVAAVDDARRVGSGPFSVTVSCPPQWPELARSRGRLIVDRLRYDELERVELLLAVLVLQGDIVVSAAVAVELLVSASMKDAREVANESHVNDATMNDVIEDALLLSRRRRAGPVEKHRSPPPTRERLFDLELEIA